jgi:pilus assembly protein CpaF
MIAIVISEKGGAERRERYEQNEITIGRVKGNDVLLPKGNVSKRHARLIYRDGRYIVTDLKSTNGTYVNHRRITHATLVREGDRIYIGDFVLRIEGEATGSERPSDIVAPDSSTSNSGSSYRVHSAQASATARPEDGQRGDVVSHFPIEHDPDESHPSLDVPGPPLVPSGFKPNSTGSAPMTPDPQTSDSYVSMSSTPGSRSVPAISSEPLTPSALRGASSKPDTDMRMRQQRQQALELLVSAVEDALGLEPLAVVEPADDLKDKIDKAIATAMEGIDRPLPGMEEQVLVDAARAELAELGPLGPLLDDDNITRVQVMLRAVAVDRLGRRVRHDGFGFGSEAGVTRALKRLCSKAGIEQNDGDQYLEGKLSGGRELFAVAPPASPDGHLIIVRRAMRRPASLDGLVRSGAISRGMATLLSHCVTARTNILVTGSRERGADQLVEALAQAAPKSHRTVWLHEPGKPIPENVPRISLGDDDETHAAAITASTKLGADHLVTPPLSGVHLASVLDAVTRGTEGVIMCATAETLRQAVDRMCADLSATRSGLSAQTAREWVGATFDLGLEMTQLRDGRRRVVRLVEFRSSQSGIHMRDIFTFAYHRTAAGGSIEGAFYASGTVPRIVDDLSARGMPLDQSIFRRHPSG